MILIIFTLSYIFFIVTYGIHSLVKSGEVQPVMYITNPYLNKIPVLTGFAFSYLCIMLMFHKQWLIVLIGNSLFVILSSKLLSKLYLSRFESGDGAGKDISNALLAGITLFIIAIVFK